MVEAVISEVKGLLERETVLVILRKKVPQDAIVFPGHFVKTIKPTDDDKLMFKARLVIEGHGDKLKTLMVNSSQSLQPLFISLILKMVAANEFDVWTSTLRERCLQSDG